MRGTKTRRMLNFGEESDFSLVIVEQGPAWHLSQLALFNVTMITMRFGLIGAMILSRDWVVI